MDTIVSYHLLLSFFLVAYLYSSVGHGGASSYLALFILFGYAKPDIAPYVLILNIVVAGKTFLTYYKAGYFLPNILLPFVLSSIPFSFLSSLIHLSNSAFSSLLGIALLFASIRLFFLKEPISNISLNKKYLWIIGTTVGSILGTVSGMLGIGGGIFLSPVLLFLGICNSKQTASISSAFIILNSISGLFGKLTYFDIQLQFILPLLFVVFAGAYFGSQKGAFSFSNTTLQKILSTVLFVASVKLI